MTTQAAIEIPGPACLVANAPGMHYDLLSIYEREDAITNAGTCPVCHVAYDAPSQPHHRDHRYIQVITGPDTWDTYACPGCRPEQYLADAQAYGDPRDETERMLAKAARDVAAGRRLGR
jgi:hypothetical protein